MMAAQPPETVDPRRKRAFLIGGALVVAALAWNAQDWFDDGDSHGISINVGDGDKDEAADIVERRMAEAGMGEEGAEIAETIRGARQRGEEGRELARAARSAAAEGEAEAAPATAGAPPAAGSTPGEEAETGLAM